MCATLHCRTPPSSPLPQDHSLFVEGRVKLRIGQAQGAQPSTAVLLHVARGGLLELRVLGVAVGETLIDDGVGTLQDV